MSASSRPRRSVLFMPASNARALEKARSLGADGLIFDLEDAVAPDAKPAARESVARALASGGYGSRELFLRVNALSTPWGRADLLSAAAMPIDAVVSQGGKRPHGATGPGDSGTLRLSGAARHLVHD